MSNIILSIRHRWAELILEGKKTVELRKSLPRKLPGKVYLYDTQKKKITGYFIPKCLRKEGSFVAYTENIQEKSLLTREEYKNYFVGNLSRSNEWRRWYEIGEVHRVNILMPVKAPRNFVYCGELEEEHD